MSDDGQWLVTVEGPESRKVCVGLTHKKGDGIMRLRNLLGLLLLLITLATLGCAGMDIQTSAGNGSEMMSCNGDAPSPYPPYCHPRP